MKFSPHPPNDQQGQTPSEHLRRVGTIVVETTGRWSGIPGHPVDDQQGKGHHLLTKGQWSKARAISHGFHKSVRTLIIKEPE